MKTEIKTKLTELAMRIARDGNDGAFEDVLDILKMIDQMAPDTVTIYVKGDEMELSKVDHDEIGNLLANTKKIPAIKRLREIHQMRYGFVLGLLPAKNAVEDTRNWDTWDTAPKPKPFLPPDHCGSCINFTNHPNFVQARDHFNDWWSRCLEHDPNVPLCVRCGSQILAPLQTGKLCDTCWGKVKKMYCSESPDVLEYDPLKVGNETEGMEAAINADPEAAERRVNCGHCGNRLLYNEIGKGLCGPCIAEKYLD